LPSFDCFCKPRILTDVTISSLPFINYETHLPGPWGAVKNLEAKENSTLAKAIQGFGSVTIEAGVAGQGGSAYDNFAKEFAKLANPDDLAFINSRQPYPDSFIPPPTFNKIIRGSPYFMYDGE